MKIPVIPAKAGIQSKNGRFRLGRIAAFAAMTAFAAAAQQMYRWVDENGHIHFTDSPPPENARKAEKIEVKPTPPSGPVKPPADYRQKEIESRGERLQKEQDAKKAAANEASAAAQKRDRCIYAQRQVQVLIQQRPVYQVNEKGERVFVEDKDRQAELDKWQDRVKTYCD